MFLQLILVLVVLIPLLAIVLDSQVGRALATRLEGKGTLPPADGLLERMSYLEGEVDRLNAEVERLDEEGRFLQKLLEDRARDEEHRLPPGERPS